MSYSSLPITSKLFQLTSLTCALALAGCGGGDGGDTIAPRPDLGVQQPGTGTGGNNGNNDNNGGGEQVPNVEPDFFLQRLSTTPTIIELSDEPTTFNVTVKAVEVGSGGAMSGKAVTLRVVNSESNGITIEGQSTQTTDADGNAVYTLRLNPKAVADTNALISQGFTLVATANRANGTAVVPQELKVSVSRKGSGDGTPVTVSTLNIASSMSTSSVSNNALNPYGDNAQLTVVAKDTKGARVQDVKVGLGIASIKGISIIGGNSKVTNADGIVTFNIKVDENLSATERNALLQGQGIAYAINIQEQNGATKQNTGNLPVALPVSDYALDVKGREVVINSYGDEQPLTITATAKNTKVPTSINGAKATIKLNNAIAGVKLSNEALTFDAAGKALVNLTIAPTLTAEQRKAIVEKGISYTVVLFEPNRSVTTETYVNKVYVPESQYQIKFATKNKNRISSFGSDAVISFRVSDKNGGAVTNQAVTASLPQELINTGLLSLDSAATQVTDNKGMVGYNVSVPANLTAAQRAKLEGIGGFVLTAKVTEASGANTSVNSERVQVTAESETVLSVKNIPNAVNVLKPQFQIQIAGKRPDGSAAAGKDVKLTISNVAGVTIQGNQQTTDASGSAVFIVNLSQDLTQSQREALVKSGIPYTVTLTDDDGITTNKYKAPVVIPVAEYRLNFGSSSSSKLLSTGGVTTLSFRVNDKNGGVIANQTVTASLPSSLTQKGLITLEGTASQVTDAQGNVSYTVRIPTGLSPEQRAELERASNFKLNARLVESSGASTNVDSNRIAVTADPSRSKTILTAKNTPSVVNLLKDQFTIQISAKRPNGSAAAGKAVKLAINNIKGISIEGGEQTTNSAGNAVFIVNIDQGLSLEQRKALEKTGIAYTAVLTDEDGIATENYRVTAAVPNAEYKINFGSSSNAQLSSSGGSTVISFRVNDKDGGVVSNQRVTVSLPKTLVESGLLTLDSAASQTTDSKGIVSYTVRVPTGLSATQKLALERASGSVLTARIIEASGASSTNSAPIVISNKVQKSSTILTSETNPKVVNILKDQFTIRVTGKRKDGSAASGQVVQLTLDKIAGVTVTNNEQTTDNAGSAVFTVNVSQGLTQAQREALVNSGITYTASLTDNDGVVTSKYNAPVTIPTAQYQVNFGSSNKVQLSSSGGSAVISFRVNDKNGGIVANQKVVASLPINLTQKGLLTLESSAEQSTNDKGLVSYVVSVPAGLSPTQKKELEAIKEFFLAAKAVEASGASSSTKSKNINISSVVEKSDIKLASISSPRVVAVTDNKFTIQVSAKHPDSSAATGKVIKLAIKEIAGVTIQGSQQTTDEAGNAVFTVNLSQDLTPEQRANLIRLGVQYTAILTDEDGSEARITGVVQVSEPVTSIQFASIATPTISELGGNGNIDVKLTTKGNNAKPVVSRAVAIQLGAKAIEYGVTVAQNNATTDFSGEATFVVTIPASLTAQQRADLKRIGINYQLSYVENNVTYKSEIQKVNVSTPTVNLNVLNATNNIENQAGYILNNVGSNATIQAQLSNQSSGEQVADQPIKIAFANKTLASLLTVNGQIGSADISANTDANGLVDFNVVVPNNLTDEQKDALSQQVLTATLTETLTGKKQQVNIKVQSMTAAISLIASPTKDLNLNGGETQIEVIAKDKKGNIVAGQRVFLALPANVVSKGVTLVSGGSQTTDDSGKAVFTIAAPNSLTDEQKAEISKFPINIVFSAADANGNIVTKRASVSTVAPIGTSEALTIGANKVVNTKGDTFKVFVRVENKNGGIANRTVRLSVDDPIKTGVRITNSTANTSSDGIATFDLTLENGASVNQAILEAGIRLKATTTTSENVPLTQNYIVAVDTATIDSYQLIASSDKSTLNTGGDQTNAIFRVTDSKGGILAGVPVQLSIENLEASGAALTTPSMVTTDANGQIDVGIILAANTINARLNHSVVINAKIVTPQYDADGKVSMQVREENDLILSAIGTELTLTATETKLKNGALTTINTTLVDAAGRAIANAGVELVNERGDVIATNATTSTDTNGKASFTIRESDLSFDNNGNLRVYARAYGENKVNTQRSLNSIDLVKVSQAGISFIDIQNVYDVNTPQTINVQIRRDTAAEAASFIGKQVEVQTTLGTFASGSAASNNVIATKTISAANITGNIITIPVTLTSQLAGITALQATVLGENLPSGEPRYRATVDTRFRATTPAKMLFQAVKSVITPGGSTEVVATVKDKNDVPVEGKTVVFSRSSDSSAGRLSAATAVTNSKGEARVIYQANASSPIGGVEINARLLEDNANIGNKSAKITVSKEAVYTTLAFSNVVSSDTIYYTKSVSISVMDGSGRAVPNQAVSIKSYATEYAQGKYCLLDSTITYQAADEKELDDKGNVIKTTKPEPKVKSEKVAVSVPQNFGWLPTEDLNYNYTLDKDNLVNEDRNGNNTLEAINPVAIIGGTLSDDGYSFITDSEGRADFQIRYPQRYSNWVKVRFDASTLLNGSENVQSINYRLPSAESDLNVNGSSLNTPWIDNISPFGSGNATCVDSMNILIDDEQKMTKVILSPYKPGESIYTVSINGVSTGLTQTTSYNSYIIDFNQAFALGSTVNVSRNGFDFSRVLNVE